MDERKASGEAGLHLKRRKKESYLKGILGALAGALVAAALWQCVAGVIGGNLHLVFGFIMAAFVYYGYFLFGGKEGKAFLYIWIGISLAAAVASFALALGVQYVDSLQIVGTASFSDYARSYSGSQIMAYLALLKRSFPIIFANFRAYGPDLFIMLVFLIIGIGNYLFSRKREENLS